MTGTCRSCGAPILWVHTAKGTRMPLDAEPVDGGNVTLSNGVAFVHGQPALLLDEPVETYVSHFATCPQAAEWRGKR